MFIYRRPLSALLAAFITVFILLSIEAMATAPAANPPAAASCPDQPRAAERRTRGHPGKGPRVRRPVAESQRLCDGQSVTSLRRPG